MVVCGLFLVQNTHDLATISHYNPRIRRTYMGTKHLDATVSWTMLPLFGFSLGKIVSDFFSVNQS
jgi:hypothetical protein